MQDEAIRSIGDDDEKLLSISSLNGLMAKEHKLTIQDYYKFVDQHEDDDDTDVTLHPRILPMIVPKTTLEKYNQLIYLFELEIARNNFDKAELHINEAIKTLPFFGHAYFRKSSLYWSLGFNGLQLRTLKLGMFFTVYSYNNHAKLFGENSTTISTPINGDLKQQEGAKDMVINNINHDYWYCIFSASVCLYEKNYESSFYYFKKALQYVLSQRHQKTLESSPSYCLTKYESFYAILNWLGILHSDQERFDLEIQYYKKALMYHFETNYLPKLEPYQLAGLYNNIGGSFYSVGKYESAIEQYNIGHSHFTQHALVFQNRGDANAQLGQLEESIKDFEKCLELSNFPHVQVDAYTNIAECHILMNDHKKAEETFKRCYEKFGAKKAMAFLVDTEMQAFMPDSELLKLIDEALVLAGDDALALKRLMIRKYFITESNTEWQVIERFKHGALERIS
ncbi:hypothetical protein C9374_008231 [Naegleria lovaniensis]|uniref:Uncharacterized protein n=1 Tax=Naegleria lovaniensis TaxID=51637 RepID=A0AA88GFP0_NAELO|nr:uncharacterized protein C9374_008231 [Naegleria lovaniensis]KAG2378592.1 hypothetical protein C9374_008231 [Naegleria lovaniensis]